jgi:hypothetical protein
MSFTGLVNLAETFLNQPAALDTQNLVTPLTAAGDPALSSGNPATTLDQFTP